MKDKTLKPCPFCGEKASILFACGNLYYGTKISCSKCFASVDSYSNKKGLRDTIAIKKWNRRGK